MKINDKDRENFKKLHVKNFLDLALILPSSFEDTTLLKRPINDGFGVVEVEIKSHFLKSGFLSIDAFCLTWNLPICFVIFHPKPFHYSLFKRGKKIFVLGKVTFSFGKWQMVQPKVITKIGQINPKYKTPLRNASLKNLIQKYINRENLEKFGLEKLHVDTLLDLHRGDKQSIKMLSEPYFSSYVKPILKYIEILNHLQKLSRKKFDFPASALLNGDEGKFVKSLPFELTNDQKNAIKDIKNDLQSPTASRRVIMGDVGCGKTMVIFASVMMAYPKKCILMTPTTILATQIFEDAKEFLPSHVKSCLVTSKDKDEDLGEFDFIIGTHALLYKNLPKCDLVMIDEQHRFGTNQRQLIHSLVSKGKKHPHFLQFTATPIPRTLSMINSMVVKYSFIKEMPFEKDIDTFIIAKEDFGKLLNHIDKEISRKRQIIVIYPLVEESEASQYQSLDEGRGFWEKKYKNVYVTHGKDKQKEEILNTFKEKGDILLATTLVEVGISLPNLSTIVIVGAEKLGLASLHQLRGRVSRNGLKGYCYLFSYSKNLQRLKDFAKTKSGFDIAWLDLQYRQGGDVLDGLIQHGEQFKYFYMKSDEEILKKAKKSLMETRG
ncbi:MAG: ATP-dependent DNA helicase RecG [Proteobacteria bacterium]|nr:MAG: ATP-dependent DNA helicase RecG [Pseudomonadota bacterium]